MIEKRYTEKGGEYFRQNPNWHKDDSAWKAEQIMKIINNNKIIPKTVADIGCGVGEVLLNIKKYLPANVSFAGFEVSIDAHKISKQKETKNMEFHLGDINSIKQYYDLLLAIDVIEHVENYFEFLLQCKKIAKYKIFHIPLDLSVLAILRNSLVLDRELVGHVHYFTKDLILEALKECDYEVIDCFYTQGACDLPRKTIKSKLAVIPRKIGYLLNKDLSARTLGGYSLLILAK